jgi:hypothetical protein
MQQECISTEAKEVMKVDNKMMVVMTKTKLGSDKMS